MFRNKIVFLAIAGIASLALPAFSQSAGSHHNEASAQAFGSFVKSTTHDGAENKETNSGGVLITYRYVFNAYNGIEANYGYSLNSLNYASGAGALGVRSYSHEISGAYVFRAPIGKLTPFALAGAASLIFDPTNFAGASLQARAAFVYGAGADISLSRHAFLRAQYRGFVYDSPTFKLAGLAGLDRGTHRAEPSIGFGYRW